MRDPGTRRYLLNTLLTLIFTIDLVTSTDTSLFAKQKATIFSVRHSATLPITNIPALSEFTLCLDLFPETGSNSWTAFSYCVENGNQPPELGLGVQSHKLVISHLGVVHEYENILKQYHWNSVCIIWKKSTSQLKVCFDDTCVYHTTTKDALFKGNGSLVLGANHNRNGAEITLIENSNFIGFLYNFQLWNYARSQDELNDCSEGNLISWTKQLWDFPRLEIDLTLRCANASNKQTSTVIATAPTTTNNTLTSTSTTTLDGSLPSNETSNTATTSISTVTSTSRMLSTTLAIKGTMGSSIPHNTSFTKPPDTLTTQPELSNTSNGDNQLANSSIISPTGNNASTTINTSSTHHIPPALRTTSSVPFSPWTNHTTVQKQESADTNSTKGNASSLATVTTSSVLPIITFTDSTKNSSPSKPSLPTYTDTPVVTKENPKISTAQLLPEIESTASEGNLSSVQTSTSASTSAINGTTYGAFSTSSNNKSSSISSHAPNTVTVTSVSHTGITELLDTSVSSQRSSPAATVTFYVVRMSVTIAEVSINEELASTLMKNMMEFLLKNTDFDLLQIIMFNDLGNELGTVPTQKSNKKKRGTNVDFDASNYNSKSIVQATSSGSPESVAAMLNNLLANNYYTDQFNNITLSIQSVNIEHLVPGTCPSSSTIYNGEYTYLWMEINPAETARHPCHTNHDKSATRYCNINVSSEHAEWENPNYSMCILLNSFEDIENVIVTAENAKYLSEQILNLTRRVLSLPENDIKIILDKLFEIIALGKMDLETAKMNLDLISLILRKADNSLTRFTNQILNITEEIGYAMDFPGDTANVTVDSLALLVANVGFKDFKELYFTVKPFLEGKDIEITLEKVPVEEAVAYIHLPEEIQDQAALAASKVQFNFFGTPSLFMDNYFSNYILNTYIISASVEGTKIEELNKPVDITLRHLRGNVDNLPVKCVFWDFAVNNNLGGWNISGCSVTSTSMTYTSCHCSHLTHFGVLLDISRTPINPFDDYILSLLSYVACGIACLCLGFSLVTYGMFRQLRKDYPSKILMNLAFSLLMLNLTFLVNNWLSSFRNRGLCISTAAILHYFLLTSFTWMGLEAVHMYFAFVKVFNSYVHKYILKLCIAGWGIPTIVVAIVLSINTNFYGNGSEYKQYSEIDDSSSLFCWIQNDTVFYVTVVAYFCVMFLINISMFIVVLLQIKSLKSTRIKDWKALFLHDIKSTLSLSFLLGITWGFAFFAWGPVKVPFMYLFVIFNTAQGMFIFVFHCVIKESVRRQWRMYLCCGQCRLDNYSDWSRLSNVDTKHGRICLTPSDSYQSTRSNTTASTSNASSLSSFSSGGYYERNFINGGGIFINYASSTTAPSIHSTIFPQVRRANLDTKRILSFMEIETQ